MISELILGVSMLTNVAMADIDHKANDTEWEIIGKCRITSYCCACNDGSGHESSSGKYLQYGHVACRWLPNGTIISIEGEQFEVVDTCGTDAIDVFIDTDECNCNLNEYKTVAIKR